MWESCSKVLGFKFWKVYCPTLSKSKLSCKSNDFVWITAAKLFLALGNFCPTDCPICLPLPRPCAELRIWRWERSLLGAGGGDGEFSIEILIIPHACNHAAALPSTRSVKGSRSYSCPWMKGKVAQVWQGDKFSHSTWMLGIFWHLQRGSKVVWAQQHESLCREPSPSSAATP